MSARSFAVPPYAAATPAAAVAGSAGTATTPARSDHVHPRYQWAPPDHNLLAWTEDPRVAANSGSLSVAGTLYLQRVHLPVAASVTNVVMVVTSALTTATSGQNFAALFTSAGALVAQSADQSTAWATTGTKTMALAGGPHSCAAGDYYLGVWANASGLPAFARASSQSAQLVNVGLSAPNLRSCTANTGLTTAAPSSLGSQTSSSLALWAALS